MTRKPDLVIKLKNSYKYSLEVLFRTGIRIRTINLCWKKINCDKLWIQSQWDQTTPQRCHFCWVQNAKLWRHNNWRQNGLNEFFSFKVNTYHLQELYKGRKTLKTASWFSFYLTKCHCGFCFDSKTLISAKQKEMTTWHSVMTPQNCFPGFCAVRIFLS